MGITWGEAEMVALDRIGWMQRVQASCSAGIKEKEEEEKDISREHCVFWKPSFESLLSKKNKNLFKFKILILIYF